MSRHILAFSYFGGKYSHLRWLLPLLPETLSYCEPFGGSASVLINRKPSELETYNDLDSNVTTFFRVLRDMPHSLVRSLALTPFSRQEYREAIACDDDGSVVSDLEKARRFYIRVQQGFSGIPGRRCESSWRANPRHRVSFLSGHSHLARAVTFQNAIARLQDIAERLITVSIENRGYKQVIQTYDQPYTLFYCDPPYPGRTDNRNYLHKFTHSDTFELVEMLNQIQGLAAVSGYRDETVDEIFKGWNRYEHAPRRITATPSRPFRTECLWTNYKFRFPRVPLSPRFRLFPRE